MGSRGERTPTVRSEVEAQSGRLRELAISMNTHVDTSTLMLGCTKSVIRQWAATIGTVADELTRSANLGSQEMTAVEEVRHLNRLGRGVVAGLFTFGTMVGGVAVEVGGSAADELGIPEWIANQIRDAVEGADQLDEMLQTDATENTGHPSAEERRELVRFEGAARQAIAKEAETNGLFRTALAAGHLRVDPRQSEVIVNVVNEHERLLETSLRLDAPLSHRVYPYRNAVTWIENQYRAIGERILQELR